MGNWCSQFHLQLLKLLPSIYFCSSFLFVYYPAWDGNGPVVFSFQSFLSVFS